MNKTNEGEIDFYKFGIFDSMQLQYTTFKENME